MRTRHMVGTALLFLFSTVAIGGLVGNVPVEITFNDDGSGSAFGTMTTARFSKNDVESIGCGTRNVGIAGGLFQFAFCQATDSAGNTILCSTENVDLVHAVRAISDFSFITFGWSADTQCTRIGFSTQSQYIPNIPSAKPGK